MQNHYNVKTRPVQADAEKQNAIWRIWNAKSPRRQETGFGRSGKTDTGERMRIEAGRSFAQKRDFLTARVKKGIIFYESTKERRWR